MVQITIILKKTPKTDYNKNLKNLQKVSSVMPPTTSNENIIYKLSFNSNKDFAVII